MLRVGLIFEEFTVISAERAIRLAPGHSKEYERALV